MTAVPTRTAWWRRAARAASRSQAAWALTDASIVRVAREMQWARATDLTEPSPTLQPDELLQRISPERRVMHGPFRGMRYPFDESIGSTLLPKLLGSYEIEVSGFVEHACFEPYSSIVDVGSAEGYYAVGLAMRKPRTPVFAFDTDSRARELCRHMAELNGVAGQVSVRSECTPEVLAQLDLGAHALIILDCEGYEATLLSPEVVTHLRHHTLLVELHDFITPGISRLIHSRFQRTHHVETVLSMHDTVKATVFGYPELVALSPEQRRQALSERRPCVMQWYYLVPKQAAL
jgi:precorrin-6B methylase 2